MLQNQDAAIEFGNVIAIPNVAQRLLSAYLKAMPCDFALPRHCTGLMMAAGRVTFSSAFMLNFFVFLLFSYLNSQSYYFNWRLSLIGHGSHVPKSALEPSSMRYSDLRCLCRVRHFELKSWHTRMKLKRYL